MCKSVFLSSLLVRLGQGARTQTSKLQFPKDSVAYHIPYDEMQRQSLFHSRSTIQSEHLVMMLLGFGSAAGPASSLLRHRGIALNHLSSLNRGGSNGDRDSLRSSRSSIRGSADAFPEPSRYVWRGHSCSFVKSGQGPPVLLLHGFAGSAFNCWRSTLPALAQDHTVYAIDLLGLGASDQPSDVEYSIDLWREQCADFISEQMSEPPIVIGHSFGSVIALELARELAEQGTPARAVGMMNCGVGMNNKNALKVEDWRREQQEKGVQVGDAAPAWQLALFAVVLSLVDFIFNQKWLLMQILERFATADNVRNALEGSVYINANRVTDDLVNDYLSLANNKEAAVEVLRQIYTNDGGPLPFRAASVLPDDFPILTVWGTSDNLAPITGPVGKFFRKRSENVQRTRFEEVNAGHVPQDDVPELTNSILKDWLAQV